MWYIQVLQGFALLLSFNLVLCSLDYFQLKVRIIAQVRILQIEQIFTPNDSSKLILTLFVIDA